jgi:hypothetical protein
VKAFRMAFVSEERIRPDRDVAIAARYNVPGKRQVGHRPAPPSRQRRIESTFRTSVFGWHRKSAPRPGRDVAIFSHSPGTS